MGVTLAQIERARSDAADVWTFGDRILYRMCEEHPAHEKVEVVVGKVWLIGRSHAAAVERRVIPTDTDRVGNDAFYEFHVAPALIKSDLDLKIQHVRQHPEFSREALPAILEAHQHLLALFEQITKQQKRSLASKYLHFHAPAQVPIYDSIAARMLLRIMPKRRMKRGVPGEFDAPYMRFSLLMLDLREEIEREHGARLSPRELDRLLLQTAAGVDRIAPTPPK
jgi:hypothetical protein